MCVIQEYESIKESLIRGELVFFLGAGASLAHALGSQPFQPGSRLPSSSDLAQYLAQKCEFIGGRIEGICQEPREPGQKELHHCALIPAVTSRDLPKIAQYLVTRKKDEKFLYAYIRDVFLGQSEQPNAIHTLIANLVAAGKIPPPIVFTTNYDLLLEKIYDTTKIKFHVLSYIAASGDRNAGKFRHRAPNGSESVIRARNQLIPFKGVPVIVKMHGTIHETKSEADSYVITEEDYIRYLSQTSILNQLPPDIVSHIRDSRILFVGYSLSDWNLRVILSRLWEDQRLKTRSWAVRRLSQYETQFEQDFWEDKNVGTLNRDIDEVVSELRAMMPELL
jgi:hypothetical protein